MKFTSGMNDDEMQIVESARMSCGKLRARANRRVVRRILEENVQNEV